VEIVSAFAYHSGGGSLRTRGGDGISTKIPGGSGWLREHPMFFLENYIYCYKLRGYFSKELSDRS